MAQSEKNKISTFMYF